MHSQAWHRYAMTFVFVLLWSSGAIFSRLALTHAAPFTVLLLRFALAAIALMFLAVLRRRLWPATGTRRYVALTGLVLVGGYSSFYLLSLDHGITPGVLATILGAQPILTLFITERRFAIHRLLGLMLALVGLYLVALQPAAVVQYTSAGLAFSLATLACVTIGAAMQKRIDQAPIDVLPLQYVVSILLCAAWLPSQQWRLEINWEFAISVIWLGLVISVGAQLLLYRLIQTTNLVRATSVFYFVPMGTALLDYLVFGHSLTAAQLIGMGAIIGGLFVANAQRS
ncbi:MAG TPA: DMT family transporter [Steroidobacter sp.]